MFFLTQQKRLRIGVGEVIHGLKDFLFNGDIVVPTMIVILRFEHAGYHLLLSIPIG